MGVCNCSMFCCMLLYVHSSIAIILMGKRELVAFLICLPGVSWWLGSSSSRCHGENLDKLKARDFNATSLSTYDFSTLYTTLPHNLIKDKLIDLIESTFQREGSPYLACSDRNAFFTSEKPKKYHAWSCQNVCDALTFLLDNIFIRFGTKLYRQVVGIPMGTNCAPLVADLFLFCYERDFMMSLSDDKQADVFDAFNTTSRYLDDILNINNVYFVNMVSQIYPSELQLNKANASDTEAAFLDLHLSISNGIVSTKIYDKRDDFDFEIVNFPFLDGDVPRSTSYGVYISQLIRFARASSYVTDFNTRNKLLKVSNGAKIRNRYNQVPHLTQDTNGKVTNSQKTPQTRAKRSALSQQVTKKHI